MPNPACLRIHESFLSIFNQSNSFFVFFGFQKCSDTRFLPANADQEVEGILHLSHSVEIFHQVDLAIGKVISPTDTELFQRILDCRRIMRMLVYIPAPPFGPLLYKHKSGAQCSAIVAD